ncbi:hypothetical protein BDQ17DRAFT_1332575 [Cyathus striatus]|nr:hypothetical protein BDQ17DRAFT_1332575 [Cyathus striatus]
MSYEKQPFYPQLIGNDPVIELRWRQRAYDTSTPDDQEGHCMLHVSSSVRKLTKAASPSMHEPGVVIVLGRILLRRMARGTWRTYRMNTMEALRNEAQTRSYLSTSPSVYSPPLTERPFPNQLSSATCSCLHHPTICVSALEVVSSPTLEPGVAIVLLRIPMGDQCNAVQTRRVLIPKGANRLSVREGGLQLLKRSLVMSLMLDDVVVGKNMWDEAELKSYPSKDPSPDTLPPLPPRHLPLIKRWCTVGCYKAPRRQPLTYGRS